MCDTPQKAEYASGFVEIVLTSGQTLRFAVADSPILSKGTQAQLSDIEISPFGLHWPQLDEDLSIRGIQAGDLGQRKDSGI